MSTKASSGKKKFNDFNYSSIFEHQRVGKKMVAPFNQIPAASKASWMDDVAPEMLWAYLVAYALPRNEYLECFRHIVQWSLNHLPKFEDRWSAIKAVKPDAEGPLACTLEMSELAAISTQEFDAFAAELQKWPNCIEALGALGGLETIPGKEHWTRCFPPVINQWDVLAPAIAPAAGHQSETTTDIRWLKILSDILSGRIRFPETMCQDVEDVINFPNAGDLRKVRPFIRSTEGALRAAAKPKKWISEFWDEAFRNTQCLDSSNLGGKAAAPDFRHDQITMLRERVHQGFFDTNVSSAIDVRHDGAFGFMLYALSIAEEICTPELSVSVAGRSGLRTLAELYISFAYLAAKDNKTLWFEYRNFGVGQAKLAFLKVDLGDGAPPDYVSQDSLFEMANEDSWQEFIDMNTGHWANKNLRTLAIEGGTKDIYDRYYDWTSTYSHGHWGAIRDSNFVTCFNPLHRFHRIPRRHKRELPSVIADAVSLVNLMTDVLKKLYPVLGGLPLMKLEV